MADNFTPGETIGVNATTSGVSASFSLAQSANYPDVLVTNTGSVTAFVAFGSAAQVPNGAGATPVLGGQSLTMRKGIGTVLCSAITATSSAQLYLTAGEGKA